MQVAILADTHVPSRVPAIPEWVQDELRAADHTIHAGDFGSRDALEAIRRLSTDLTAVAGNVDPADLDLDPVASVELGGVEFVVTHGTGSPAGYRERVARTVEQHATSGPTVGVAGHIHRIVDEHVGGHRILNPGSATGARPAAFASMMTATVDGGDLAVTVHEQ